MAEERGGGTLRTILLNSEEKREEGLRVIILSGTVEYTGRKDVYRVPDYTLRLLDEQKIPYEVVAGDARQP